MAIYISPSFPDTFACGYALCGACKTGTDLPNFRQMRRASGMS